MKILLRLLRCEQAASAAEFALVLPLLLLFLFGIIDAGRFMWEFNQAEKATQMGVRFAVVADPVLNNLSSYSFATTGEVTAGNAVSTTLFDSATCSGSTLSCNCTGTSGMCTAAGFDNAAFTDIVNRMAFIYPAIGQNNVQVVYKNVGLGFAGDPNGADVATLITVKLTGLTFQPITCLVFACSITMPDFRASLTAEDLSGTKSN